ncbi:hypothetical protein B0T10DRAFT_467518 [Thelonectria olida]|uniref:Uncharacterized protein n=1 Tax=Thelonectria olida TaxID=1576542 RepID=A0A9P8VQT9_9HYPO|nr:hypothetical protein B0T10DRAFT_467518 [Thelonectria olida]
MYEGLTMERATAARDTVNHEITDLASISHVPNNGAYTDTTQITPSERDIGQICSPDSNNYCGVLAHDQNHWLATNQDWQSYQVHESTAVINSSGLPITAPSPNHLHWHELLPVASLSIPHTGYYPNGEMNTLSWPAWGPHYNTHYECTPFVFSLPVYDQASALVDVQA